MSSNRMTLLPPMENCPMDVYQEVVLRAAPLWQGINTFVKSCDYGLMSLTPEVKYPIEQFDWGL